MCGEPVVIAIKRSEIFDEAAVAALVEDRIIQQSVFPFLSDRQQIIEQDSSYFCTQKEAGNREAENEQNILGHFQKRIPAGIDPMQTVIILARVIGNRGKQDTGSWKEAMHDVFMCNNSFPDWFQVYRTDFIAVDLRKDLPVGSAKVLPLCPGTFWAVTKTSGRRAAVLV